ncbi:hypothetical protein APB26_02720 [Pseudomonas aeruginosa]|uniref:Phage tail assembly protein n=1 Tax=Pseudomonas aeruginosa TaxID=287 RepID=A0A6B1YGN2_PSEAI|nr:hypothetical protein [Pseudomonas aeruginosa]KSQ40193.1 hypothetical protein APB26_02720 [Pseudomonas aeruginosa]MZZ15696.1 hypothetical protein [Pseudomonas aeruginosa]RPV55526.1 hypothetical protein IPC838_29795 [Pseudomonas aeruginosa]HEJ4235944.1 hypothetical protein [Pseudomonas aeruginosa]HEJ5366123.1 hypothetical protein [Pseudomonas aeruginosa]
MPEMTASRVVKVGEAEVIVRELAVKDLRKMLIPSDETILDAALFEELRLSDLLLMTNLDRDAIEGLRPSELAVVVKACKEQNPHFFAMLARLEKAQRTR